MERVAAVIKEIEDFVVHLNALPREAEPSDAQFSALAQRLIQLARASVWHKSPYREALPGEELLYELAVARITGPRSTSSQTGSLSSVLHMHTKHGPSLRAFVGKKQTAATPSVPARLEL